MHTDEVKAGFRGLTLPRQVIEKIYRLNALRIFKRALKGIDSNEN